MTISIECLMELRRRLPNIYISVGEPYRNIKKVYSINIVYFDLVQGDDYVYHGKTDFVGIHKADKLMLSIKQTEMLGCKVEPSQIFPEYFVIKVNQFNDVAKDTLDQWVYYLKKNNEIRDGFTAKGINEAKELWRVDTLPEEEQKNYSQHLKNLRNDASRMLILRTAAEDRVKKARDIEIAIGMKREGVETSLISKLTALSNDEISTL